MRALEPCCAHSRMLLFHRALFNFHRGDLVTSSVTSRLPLFTSAAGLGLLGKVGIIAVCALDSHIYILYRARGPWRCGIIMGTVPPRSGSALRETARVQSPETRADPRSQTRVEISTPDARRSAGPRATRADRAWTESPLSEQSVCHTWCLKINKALDYAHIHRTTRTDTDKDTA